MDRAQDPADSTGDGATGPKTSMTRSRALRARRRWTAAAAGALCVALAAVAAVAVVPRLIADAATTGVSTVFGTAANLVDGSTAASSDAPGGARTGTAKPGDTLQWVVDGQNNASANATMNLKDVIANAGSYVPNSLVLPPNQNPRGSLQPQYTTDGGATWATGNPPANANGVGSLGTSVPAGGGVQLSDLVQDPVTALSTTGGDGYNAVTRDGLLYAAFHHATGDFLYCAQPDGSTCPGWPKGANAQPWSSRSGDPIGTAGPQPMITAWQNGTWISGDKMFFLVGESNGDSVGTGCLDLGVVPAVSCGYTVLGTLPMATNSWAHIASSGIPASDGNVYGVMTSGRTGTGASASSTASWVCIRPATGSSCGTKTLQTNVTSAQALQTGTYGGYVFASVQQAPGSAWQISCFVASGNACPGSWPVTGSTSAALGGNLFAPVLTTSGAVNGVCTITNGGGSASACWNLDGSPATANPYVGTGAGYTVANNTSGDALVIGTKVYLASGGSSIMCRDFAGWANHASPVPACSGFANASAPANYTVRQAAGVGPNCLVADGDARQITFFDARTGGRCSGFATQSVAAQPADYYCGSGASAVTSWGSLSVTGMTASAYSDITVRLKDKTGAYLKVPGYSSTSIALTPGQTLDLSSIPFTGNTQALTADVQVNGVTDSAGVTAGQIRLTWNAAVPPQTCFRTIAPPNNCDAPASLGLVSAAQLVTTFPGGGDAPNGNWTGTVRFDDRASAAQCGLSMQKATGTPDVRPGNTVGYNVTVRNTGSLPYGSASFTDDLTDTLHDAVFNNDQRSTVGTASYSPPVLSWSGPLAPGQVATITYSVTIHNPDQGDRSLLNTIVSPSPGSNCPQGSADPACTVTVRVSGSDVAWRKVDGTAAKNLLPGAQWTFTPVDAHGVTTGPAITVTDCAAAPAASCTGPDLDPLAGAFRLSNLGSGTYQLVETRAPIGFRVNPAPIVVTIQDTTTTLNLADVVNQQLPVPTLPFTGGVGSDSYTIVGVSLLTVMLVLAAIVLARRRRRA